MNNFNDITVFYILIDQGLPEFIYRHYTEHLPDKELNAINRFKFKEDRERKFLGRALLSFALWKKYDLPLSTIGDIYYTQYGKPYINEEINFNISHSGKLVVCTLARQRNIGIDVEKYVKLDVNDFRQNFTTLEWKEIVHASSPLKSFYDCWTMKEAAMKADGRGLSLNLQKVIIDEKRNIEIEGMRWFAKHLSIHSDYSLCLASNQQFNIPEVEQVTYNNLFEPYHFQVDIR